MQLLTRVLTRLTAGKEIPDKWDEEVVFETDVTEELLHWRDTIVGLSDKSTPMTPPNVEKTGGRLDKGVMVRSAGEIQPGGTVPEIVEESVPARCAAGVHGRPEHTSRSCKNARTSRQINIGDSK